VKQSPLPELEILRFAQNDMTKPAPKVKYSPEGKR
jgi:hypothetical protein